MTTSEHSQPFMPSSIGATIRKANSRDTDQSIQRQTCRSWAGFAVAIPSVERAGEREREIEKGKGHKNTHALNPDSITQVIDAAVFLGVLIRGQKEEKSSDQHQEWRTVSSRSTWLRSLAAGASAPRRRETADGCIRLAGVLESRKDDMKAPALCLSSIESCVPRTP